MPVVFLPYNSIWQGFPWRDESIFRSAIVSMLNCSSCVDTFARVSTTSTVSWCRIPVWKSPRVPCLRANSKVRYCRCCSRHYSSFQSSSLIDYCRFLLFLLNCILLRTLDIEPDFKTNLQSLIPLLLASDSVVKKRINGGDVTGKQLLEYFKVYVRIYQGDELPEPKSMLQVRTLSIFLRREW